MSEPLVTKCTAGAVENRLSNHFFNTKDRVGTRFGYLFHTLIQSVAGSLDAVVGTVVGIARAICGNRFEGLNTLAEREMSAIDTLISEPVYSILRVLNPEAEIPSMDERGIFADGMPQRVAARVDQLLEGNWFSRHIEARLAHLIGMGIVIIARLVDFIIGLVSLAFALLFCGKNVYLNRCAYQGLKVTAIVTDVLKGIAGFIHPHQLDMLESYTLWDACIRRNGSEFDDITLPTDPCY